MHVNTTLDKQMLYLLMLEAMVAHLIRAIHVPWVISVLYCAARPPIYPAVAHLGPLFQSSA